MMIDPQKKLRRAARKLEKELDYNFAQKVKLRDGLRCAICGNTQNLHCHHIIPREDRNFRHNEINGITLCCLHHKFSLKCSPHKNAFAFFQWLEKNKPETFAFLKYNYQYEL